MHPRRTSLPAVVHSARNTRHNSNNLLSKLEFLKELSEFDIDPPFLSPASSSSSDNSPMPLSPTTRPASARLHRKENKFSPMNKKRINSSVDASLISFFQDKFLDNINDNKVNKNEENSYHDSEYKINQKISNNLNLKYHQSNNSPPLSLSLWCSPQESPFLPKFNGIVNKRLAVQQKNSHSKESDRSPLWHYDNFIENDNMKNDLLDNNFYNQYETDFDVQKLRETLKMQTSLNNCNNGQSRPKLQSFTINANGRIFDAGVRKVLGSGKLFKPSLIRNNKNRRATCPEIWLSAAEDERRNVTKCEIKIFGNPAVGKTFVARQLIGSADVLPADDLVSIASEDLQRVSYTKSFLINNNEIELEILLNSKLSIEYQNLSQRDAQKPQIDDILTLYIVVYTIDNRESFNRAAKILYRLYKHRVKSSIPLILVANKIDLQRKRRVTSMEGKMLAKIYKCSFVEVSALLSMNIDSLWQETLKTLNKIKTLRDRALEQGVMLNGSNQHSSSHLVGRFLNSTRRFAKSCEELVARMVAL